MNRPFAMALVAFVSGQCSSEPASHPAIPPETPPPNNTHWEPGKNQYGVSGSVTAEELQRLQKLQMPASYEGVKNAIGLPYHRGADRDYYVLDGISADDSKYLIVRYSASGQAVSYEFGGNDESFSRENR